uniref:Uncharacterized protein n=1 Tax=Globisporangium ultimum (strain ATCC 200006 / CBS 805.95 / DAOM BR144) TaxID=431595 RepID=K3W9L2_GLOUD
MDSAEQTFLSKKKKTSNQRQREEIAYLLGKVRELEGTLRTIAHEMAAAASSESAVAALPDSSVPVDSVWEATAKHQLEQKKRAESENVKLREKLAGEIGFAKSLGRMLRKRK